VVSVVSAIKDGKTDEKINNQRLFRMELALIGGRVRPRMCHKQFIERIENRCRLPPM
jgi:hypothetical protein